MHCCVGFAFTRRSSSRKYQIQIFAEAVRESRDKTRPYVRDTTIRHGNAIAITSTRRSGFPGHGTSAVAGKTGGNRAHRERRGPRKTYRLKRDRTRDDNATVVLYILASKLSIAIRRFPSFPLGPCRKNRSARTCYVRPCVTCVCVCEHYYVC